MCLGIQPKRSLIELNPLLRRRPNLRRSRMEQVSEEASKPQMNQITLTAGAQKMCAALIGGKKMKTLNGAVDGTRR